MITKTKIICTIGPAVNSLEKIKELIASGMNVARLNFSHGTHEDHIETIGLLKRAREELDVPLAIMIDTKGSEIRLGRIQNGRASLSIGHRWLLVRDEIEGNNERVSVRPASILDDLPIGVRVLFNDGHIAAKVISNTSQGVMVEIENGGEIPSGKGVNVPDVPLKLPTITEADIADIRFGCQQDIDIVAISFVRNIENIITIKNLLRQEGKPEILVLAKIENYEGVENFDSIIQVADGAMVARGDLGVEVPLSQVPRLQKEMIRKSYLAGKPVAIATQMLESMLVNPRPTRAEVSDIANAIYDSASSLMLSGETAAGKYPIEAVRVMATIIRETEMFFDFRAFFELHSQITYHDVPSSVTLATVKTAYSSGAKAIFAYTSGGATARLLGRLRPSMPIIAMTDKLKCYHQMSFFWGVVPVLTKECIDFSTAFHQMSEFALSRGLASYGDLVVSTAGYPFGVPGTTNMIIVESIGDVLVRGHSGIGKRLWGNIALVLSPETIRPYQVRGRIIVIPRCDEQYLPLIQEAIGIVLQNPIDDKTSEAYALQVSEEAAKSLIVRADAAFNILKEGQLVTLDPQKALVYKGVVR